MRLSPPQGDAQRGAAPWLFGLLPKPLGSGTLPSPGPPGRYNPPAGAAPPRRRTTEGAVPIPAKRVQELERVSIRFAGDSGDGMQVTGTKFTEATALFGNDLSTFPDFPAEIRAPAGIPGRGVGLPGPLRLRGHPHACGPPRRPRRAEPRRAARQRRGSAPRRDGDRQLGRVHRQEPRAGGLRGGSAARRCASAARGRGAPHHAEPRGGQGSAPRHARGGPLRRTSSPSASCTGSTAGPWSRRSAGSSRSSRATCWRRTCACFGPAGTSARRPRPFRSPTWCRARRSSRASTGTSPGNQALAWGIIAAGQRIGQPVFLGAYPITPASDVLHDLARYRHFGVKTFQAEDEIAAASAAIGAAFAGQLAICTTSGPGFVLKQEAIGLAVMCELPLVVVDIQRAGPSTGMPTKAEQADLLLALFGRNSDSPVAVLAPATPGDCFTTMHRGLRPRGEVHDAGGGALRRLPRQQLRALAHPRPRDAARAAAWRYRTDPEGFRPYLRDPETLARPWAVPGTPGPRAPHRRPREGGRQRATSPTCPRNHARMVELRAEKVARIAQDIPPAEVHGADRGRLLVVGWGGTHGAITAAVEEARAAGLDVVEPAPAPPEPLPGEPRRGAAAASSASWCRSSTAASSALLLRAKFLVPAESLAKVAGPAVPASRRSAPASTPCCREDA